MVVKVSGKIDGKEVIFERAEGDRWNVTVPYDLDGMYSGHGSEYPSIYAATCEAHPIAGGRSGESR